MTTQTSTAANLARVNAGVAGDSISKHVSAAVLPDVIKTKTTNGLGDQASHALTTVTLVRPEGNVVHANIPDVKASLPAFNNPVTKVNS